MCIFARDSVSIKDNSKKKSEKRKPVILHLDDDKDFLDIFVIVFKNLLEITSVNHGKIAIQLLKEKQFDAVITDYEMPEMDGLQFLQEVRKQNNDIPIIFYTGQGNEEIAREAFILGATDYFTKEINSFAHKEKLVNSIRNAIKKSRTEKAREESEGKFRELFHNVSDAIFLYKIEDEKRPGKFVEVNDIACQRLGYSREELLEMTPVDINAHLEKHHFIDLVEKIKSRGKLILESGHKTKDGRIIPVEISTHIFTLGEDEVVLSVARDLSERLKIRRVLQENEKRFRLLYEEAPVPYQSLDEEGYLLEINNTWLELMGYTKDEVIGKHFSDFILKTDRYKFPESFRNFKVTGTVHNRIYQMVKKDGSIISVEIEGRIATDEDGNFKQTHCIFQDITQKLLNEDRIRHLNRVLKAIRNVNQLIVKEKNRDELMDKVCDLLIETNGYHSSWIILTDGENNFKNIYEAGVQSRPDLFYREVRAGNYPSCINSVMNENNIIILTGRKGTCDNCPYKEAALNNTRMSVRLEHDGKVFGALVVSMPATISANEEEKSLFREVADDIAYALNSFDVEEKRRETASFLTHREEMLKEIFNNIHSGIAVYEAFNEGEDFIFRQFNRAAQKIEDVKEENLIGKKVSEVFPGVKEFGIFQVFQRVWKTGIPEHYPMTLYRDNRINGWRENFVFKLSTGEVVTIYDDVTDQKKTGESLKKSKELLWKIIDTIPACIFVKDIDGKYLLTNKCLADLYKRTPKEMIGTTDWDYSAERPGGEEEVNTFLSNDQQIINGNRDSFTTEEKFTNRNGITKYFRTTKVPLSFNKERDSVLGIAMDITDLHSIKETLRIKEIAMEDSLNAIAIGDLNFKLTYVNKACMNLWGYTSLEEMLGRRISEFWTNRDQLSIVRESLNSKGKWTGEMDAVRKDGSMFSVYLISQVIRDKDDKPVCVMASFMDVSQRKANEKALRESEEKYRTIFETTGTSIIILEEDMTISLVNSEFERFSGYSASEVEGKKNGLLIVHPDDRKKLARNHKQRRENNQPIPHQYDFRFLNKNGEVKNVLLTVDMIPGTTQSIASMIDITYLKKIEQELRDSKDKLKTIIKNMPVMMDAFDENLILTEWNMECERVTGYSAKEMVGNPEAMNILYPESEVRKNIIEYINNGPNDFRDIETEITCRDGSKKTISWSNISRHFPIPGWNSWSIGVDVTYRKNMENKLINKNRELNDFAYRVSHDLKNPLFILAGYLNAIKDDPSLFDEYFEKTILKTEQLVLFINEILNLSRAGKIISRKEDIHLNDLIQGIFLKSKSKEIKGEIILPESSAIIKADREGIKSIFSNLIQNSLRYRDVTKEKLIVQVETIKEDNRIKILYRDNGIGLSEGNIDKIFEPGFTASNKKGTGFGLTIVKKVMDAHGGSIKAHSEGPGKGLEFTIILPSE